MKEKENRPLRSVNKDIIAMPDVANTDYYHLYDKDHNLIANYIDQDYLNDDQFVEIKYEQEDYIQIPYPEIQHIINKLKNFNINIPSFLSPEEANNHINTQLQTLANYIHYVVEHESQKR